MPLLVVVEIECICVQALYWLNMGDAVAKKELFAAVLARNGKKVRGILTVSRALINAQDEEVRVR